MTLLRGEELVEKGKLLEWAEDNPELAKNSIDNRWRIAGYGYRENYFNFSMCIEDAKKVKDEKGI